MDGAGLTRANSDVSRRSTPGHDAGSLAAGGAARRARRRAAALERGVSPAALLRGASAGDAGGGAAGGGSGAGGCPGGGDGGRKRSEKPVSPPSPCGVPGASGLLSEPGSVLDSSPSTRIVLRRTSLPEAVARSLAGRKRWLDPARGGTPGGSPCGTALRR